jgi:hypothetical protein
MTRRRAWRRWLGTLPDLAWQRQVLTGAVITALSMATAYGLLFDGMGRPAHAIASPPSNLAQTAPASLRVDCDLAPVRDIALHLRLSPLLGQPSDEQAHGALVEASAHLLVSGSFDQLHDFVLALSRLPAALRIDDMQWVPANRQRLDLHARVLCLRLSATEETL